MQNFQFAAQFTIHKGMTALNLFQIKIMLSDTMSAVVIVFALLLIWLHGRRSLSHSSIVDNAPDVRIVVPWIGHAIQYMQNPNDFLNNCRWVY